MEPPVAVVSSPLVNAEASPHKSAESSFSAAQKASPSESPPHRAFTRTETNVDGLQLSEDIIAALGCACYEDVIGRLDMILSLSDGHTKDGPKVSGSEMQERRGLFQQDVLLLRHRMRQARRGFLNPRSSYTQWWDLITALALLYTCFVTPFEVAIVSKAEIGALFYINQVINMIFIVDMFVQFVMPVPDSLSGELIRDHRILARRYLRGWFTVDLVSVLPIDVIVAIAPNILPTENTALVRVFKLMRILRLFKLMRVLRASRIMQRWENAIALSSSARSIATAWFSFCVILHWFACVWALLPQFVMSWRELYETTLPIRMAERILTDPTCSACAFNGTTLAFGGDSSVWECGTMCLTRCERQEMVLITGKNPEYVYNRAFAVLNLPSPVPLGSVPVFAALTHP